MSTPLPCTARLANTVNNEKIKSDTNDRLVAMGGEALAEALAALGDSDAASEALAAAQNAADSASSTASTTESVISDATQTLQQKLSATHLEILREAKMQTVQHSFVSRQRARQ